MQYGHMELVLRWRTEEESLSLLQMLRDPGSFDLALGILEANDEWVLDWLHSVMESTTLSKGHPIVDEYRKRQQEERSGRWRR
jgi:hypothetical protein